MGNQSAREALSRAADRPISEEEYSAVKDRLVGLGLILKGQECGGWVLKQRSRTSWEYDPEVRDAIKGLQGQAQRDGRAQPLVSIYLCLTQET